MKPNTSQLADISSIQARIGSLSSNGGRIVERLSKNLGFIDPTKPIDLESTSATSGETNPEVSALKAILEDLRRQVSRLNAIISQESKSSAIEPEADDTDIARFQLKLRESFKGLASSFIYYFYDKTYFLSCPKFLWTTVCDELLNEFTKRNQDPNPIWSKISLGGEL